MKIGIAVGQKGETMVDLIDRKAAIDETWKEPSYTDPYNVLTEVRERIQSLQSAQRWIPVSEKLPEENEMVLISAKYIGHLSQNAPYVEEGFFTHDGWYSAYGDDYSELLAKVVAWMPLPEPYKPNK